MRAWFEPTLGDMGALIAQVLVWIVIALAAIAILVWAFRRFSGVNLGSLSRGRVPRLAIVDAVAIDAKRRLVLLRRDNLEHLILIGGPTDVVVETLIKRPQSRGAATHAAGSPSPDVREREPAGTISIRQVDRGRTNPSGRDIPAPVPLPTAVIPPQPVIRAPAPEAVPPAPSPALREPSQSAAPIADHSGLPEASPAVAAETGAAQASVAASVAAPGNDAQQTGVPGTPGVPGMGEPDSTLQPVAELSPRSNQAGTPPAAGPEPQPPQSHQDVAYSPAMEPQETAAPQSSRPVPQPSETADSVAEPRPQSAPEKSPVNPDDTVERVGELEREMARLLGEAAPKPTG